MRGESTLLPRRNSIIITTIGTSTRYRYPLGAGRHRKHHGGVSVRGLSVLAIAATVAGCCRAYYADTNFYKYRSYHGELSSSSSLSSSPRLLEILPSDLDVLYKNNSNNFHEDNRLMGALGAQLLLFAGWTHLAGKGWTRPDVSQAFTLQDRLERITPTWKTGGTLDYSFHSAGGLFGDYSSSVSAASPDTQITTVAQLATTLGRIGFTAHLHSLDEPSRQALQAMLSWKLPSLFPSANHLTKKDDDDEVLLLIFSFDATPLCYNVQDCPFPGPSNELLAATALQFVKGRQQQQTTVVHMIAQWEVAAALERQLQQQQQEGAIYQRVHITPVGTPGKFQNTATIFELMLDAWKDSDNHPKRRKNITRNPPQAILLAHPDHLRRVYWTVQTILHQSQSNYPPPFVARDNQTQSNMPKILPAMYPYNLKWPLYQQRQQQQQVNFFDAVPQTTVVHTLGQRVMTNWYDDQFLGFFPDGDPQKWTHQRQVWILYDQWAMLKGIVTGTIDIDLVLRRLGS